ncbi:MAG TPA: glutamate--cysteine ligase [Thiotrichaceae bacterium]|jgi:glutamate--cysteine ligase|nr:glutamate--cysteine ligase [Thiotrichaceae bacterium]HIM08615.1 glutamate--cysteine ligase [Gammaproteobacteria bacterium]
MNEIATVPHLTTALTGPFQSLERLMLDKQAAIESWFRNAWRETQAPFYASVDLRNAGYKIAPVDTNLFPAGFNNLNPAFESLCIHAIQMAVEHTGKPIDKVLIIPENHTRNLFYLENLASLQTMIEKAGFETRIGSISADIETPTRIDLESSKSVLLESLQRDQNRVVVGDFNPDLILLNNDLSAGKPEILNDIEQVITPPMSLGWSKRLKSDHFAFYQRVAQEFAALIDIDPWLIDPMFRNCGEVNFMKREGIDCLSKNVESLLESIRSKYKEHNIESEPFVMVKADAGTYGMGVMTIRNADELAELNRKERTKMAKTKEGQKVTQVIIQEGVYTHETWGKEDTVAEPVVYMMDHQVVGGFYRVHEKRSASQNLNAPGMRFEPLAFDDCCITPDLSQDDDCRQNRFYTYGVIARLALLAAAREITNAV